MALHGYNLKLFKDKKGMPIPFNKLSRTQQREIGYGSGMRKAMHLVGNHINSGASDRAIRHMFSDKMSSGNVRSILPYDSTDELHQIGKGVLQYSRTKADFLKNEALINQIPAEYGALYNQGLTGIPSDDVTEIVDELSGYKMITTKDVHGNIVSQKRVAIPLNSEQQQRRDSLLSTINSTMGRMNDLLQNDPEFNIDEPIAAFGNFVNNITSNTSDLFNKLFANAGIDNFRDKMDGFRNNYANKFEDEMRLAKQKGVESLVNKGYGEQSSVYQDYVSKMDANLARGKTDIARDSEMYGERLFDNQTQRDLGVYSAQLAKDKFNIDNQSDVLDRQLSGKSAKLDKRFADLKALQNVYDTTSRDYNVLMDRFNTSQQTLGQYLLDNRSNYDKLDMHRNEMGIAREKNLTDRYRIDKQHDGIMQQIALQKHLERKGRVSSFKKGLEALAFKTAGTYLGGKMGG